MELTIVTGLSGAGRTSALRRLEDLKYFCVDNLPPELIPSFAELCLNNPKPLKKVAIAVDTRMGDWFNTIYDAIEKLKKMDLTLSILFLDSSDVTLVSRFKQTRRPHPISQSGDILSGVHCRAQAASAHQRHGRPGDRHLYLFHPQDERCHRQLFH